MTIAATARLYVSDLCAPDDHPDHHQHLLRWWDEYYERRDDHTRNRLVVHYSPLVKYAASRAATRLPRHADRDDLYNNGVLGLIDAIERYDPSRAVRFENYALRRIQGAIWDGMRHEGWVPRSIYRAIRMLDTAYERLTAQLKRPPEIQELAQELGWSLPKMRRVLTQISRARLIALEPLVEAEIDIPATSDDQGMLDPVTALEKRLVYTYLRQALDEMSPRERDVLALRREFLHLRRMRSLWGSSWFVSTVGGAPLGAMKRRIENQEVA